MSLPGFDQSAAVFGRDGTTGKYTVSLKTGLVCRLTHLSFRQSPATGAQRRELAGIRSFLWEPSYVMPETAQIEVVGISGPDGVTAGRWNIVAGTIATLRGPSGAALYKQADLVRAA